jgi:hypothetical protein
LKRYHPAVRLAVAVMLLTGPLLHAQGQDRPWRRHTIDASSRGADGVRLADANGDGLPDIATGWEEGGRVRVYLNPGPAGAKAAWPAVTVGAVGSVEDAVLVDLDRDGAMDVVSCCEGNTRSMFVHWAPKERSRYQNSDAWTTEALPLSRGMMRWMFCLPLQVDGKHGVDLVAGGKDGGAALGWWEAPADPRDLSAWKWHPLRPLGWLMSLMAEDMDGDGDLDVLASDRKGAARGCFWLENPGPAHAQGGWKEHAIGGQDREVMFLRVVDLDRDGLRDVIVAAKPQEILCLRREARDGRSWEPHSFSLPASAGRAKAVSSGDMDADGDPDLVFTCESATDGRSGVMWLENPGSLHAERWKPREISGPDGIKHDLVELLDLDGDGDQDALTCEETKNLGVFWYENPLRSR